MTLTDPTIDVVLNAKPSLTTTAIGNKSYNILIHITLISWTGKNWL